MDVLLSKLTNLAYDFFGVVLPGLVLVGFGALFWLSLGTGAPLLSGGVVPGISVGELLAAIDSIGVQRMLAMLFVTYFAGHLLLWVGKRADLRKDPAGLERTAWALAFRVSTPTLPYDEDLEPQFERAKATLQNRLGRGTEPTNDDPRATGGWRQFYPVAGQFIRKSGQYSLLATYQHKYTLHRSITVAVATLFWCNVITAIVNVTLALCGSAAVPWWIHVIWAIVLSAFAWGFSGSYRWYWQHWGNTLIAETLASTAQEPNEPRQPVRH